MAGGFSQLVSTSRFCLLIPPFNCVSIALSYFSLLSLYSQFFSYTRVRAERMLGVQTLRQGTGRNVAMNVI